MNFLNDLKEQIVKFLAKVSPVLAIAVAALLLIVCGLFAVILGLGTGSSAVPTTTTISNNDSLVNLTLPETEIKLLNPRPEQIGFNLRAEIADSELEREVGLMNRTELTLDRGMLFVYPEPVQASFWMKNTYIPLDIIFLNNAKQVVKIADDAEPLNTTKTYFSEVPVQYILETNSGFTEQYNLTTGQQLEFSL